VGTSGATPSESGSDGGDGNLNNPFDCTSKVGYDSLGHVNIPYMRWMPTILHQRVAL